MTTPSLAEVPVRSSLALTRRWVALLAPPLFDARILWLTWLGSDGRQLPAVVPVEDLPSRPDARLLHALLRVHDGIAREHLNGTGHLAMALCRPGEPVTDQDDEEWADALRELLDERIDGSWSLHLAAGGRVEPLVEAPNFFVQLGRAAAGRPWPGAR